MVATCQRPFTYILHVVVSPPVTFQNQFSLLTCLPGKTIQITETSCFVTLVSRDAKESLLSSGINVRDMFSDVYDVDQIITNVTIKGAPFELSDSYILHHLKTYGDVIENSIRRGKIKGTDIETGTRYLQMVNVKDALPTIVNIGRFRIRIFSDNKTECRICKEVGHPFYRCPMKNNPHLGYVVAVKVQHI